MVAELSSFQLETIVTFRPHVAVLLNLAPDHLDRYANLADYYAAKARIFLNQTPEDCRRPERGRSADPGVGARAPVAAAPLQPDRGRWGTARSCATAAWSSGGKGARRRPASVAEIRIQGLHNLENSLAAAAAAAAIGAPAAAIGDALKRFPGLPHRLELVAEMDGVRYVNDSKGTNVGAVVKSLEGYAGGVILIAGGKDKGSDFAPLRPLGGVAGEDALCSWGRRGA